ncbi:MAG: SagB/ThcOx family dehydrogenase, partial [Planctomycetes bacterium]|nr:SagB/ThcOx family dehydrogenase [Planctomycetota bacterium]
LREACDPRFGWTMPVGCPRDLPFFLLLEADCRRAAMQLSLGQEIAGASAFSLGMVAEFESSLRARGPWFYRRLFWEAGMVGQTLYLEAEAAGLRSTGIGAYFDDLVHDVLGLSGHGFCSLYHFTVGGPIEDRRLTSRAGYPAPRDCTTSAAKSSQNEGFRRKNARRFARNVFAPGRIMTYI